jgi:hypothetical protein
VKILNPDFKNPDPARYRLYEQGTRDSYDSKKYRHREALLVLQCLECSATGHEESPTYIFHDVLCTQRPIKEFMSESDRLKVLDTLFERAGRVLGKDLSAAHKALKSLYDLKLDGPPPRGFKSSEYYSNGDEDTPFFSEPYLYSLLGKDQARTVLSYVRSVAKAVGFKEP